MKKLFILMLSVVAMVAFATSSFALHSTGDMFEYVPSIVKSKKAMLEVSGHIRARGELADNNTDFKDEESGANRDKKAAYDARVNLMIKATVSPNTQGVIELQSNTQTADSYGWGSCTAAKGTYTNAGNCKPADITLRQAYIAYQSTALLGNLSGFKVGHMPIALGNGMFYNHTEFGDDALIFWTRPADNTEIAFAAIKGQEGVNGDADDVDIYAITADTKMGGANIGGDIAYLHDKMFTGTQTVTLWNLGLRGDTSVGDVKLSADVAIQTGEMEQFLATGEDMDLSGWAVEVKASTTVGSVGVHGGVGYGSGDDIGTGDDYEGFINSLGNGQDYTYLYDQKARTSAQTAATAGSSTYVAGNAARTGLANTMYVNVGASTNVNPDVKVSGDVYYLQAAEEVSSAAGLDDDEIGWEIDGKVTYQIDSNLVWYVEAGYLIAGDFYKNITGATVEPDDAYSVRHGVVLTF